MSQTKVTDALRNVTAVDGTKIDAVDGAKITTGTIPEARITSLDATKLTGNIANARIPASAVTQHVTGFDDSSIRADILKLALHQAIDGNRVAYNLEDSFIDGFEDDTGIQTETTCDRDADGEYVASLVVGSLTDWPYTNANTQTITDGGNNMSGVPSSTDHTKIQTTTGYLGYWMTSFSYSTTWMSVDYLAQYTWSSLKVAFSGQHSQVSVWRLEHSNDGTNWTVMNQTGTSTAAWTGQSLTTENVVNSIDTSTGVFTNSNPGPSGATGGVILTFGTAVTARYLRFGVGNIHTNYNDPTAALQTFIPRYQPLQINATGTLISDAQTASSSRTSCSGVIIYSDASGTATLGTDLKIYFTCNNGTNWTEANSYGTATTYSGTKKLVKLGATTCTAGTQVAMKAVWANQASGSKETRLHGWAVNY
jgi:hypothetical protein